MLEVHYSKDSGTRALITRDSAQLLRIRFESWFAENSDAAYPPTWIPIGNTTITDTLERAKAIATEGLEEDNSTSVEGDV